MSTSKLNSNPKEGYHDLESRLGTIAGAVLHTNHMRAVVLVIRLALRAFHARLDLSANTDTVSWLESLHFWSSSQNLADDLVTNANGRNRQVSPASRDCMDIRAADAATFVLDVDIIIFEDLGGELGGCQLQCSGAIGKIFAMLYSTSKEN